MAVGSPPFHTTNGGWDQPPFSASSGHRDQNSARDEAPQRAVQLVQLGKQPSGQRRQAKGRNGKRHQKPRDPCGNVFLHKQHQDTQQPQHRREDGEQTSGKTQQEREHGHKQGQHQHKGSGKNFEYDPHRGFLLFPVYVYYNSEKIGTQGCPGPPHFWSQ